MTPLTPSLASKRVMELPDVLIIVFETLDVCELVQLLRVNRLFFKCGAPLVWSNVWGIEALLGLLTATDLPALTPSAPWPAVELHWEVIETKLPRFNLYCTMVRKLHVYRHVTRGYQWLGLENLNPRALLLPHLTELVIKRRQDGAHSSMLPKILALFCGRSCAVVRVGGTLDSSVPWLGHTDSGLALTAIHPHAAVLKHLDLFVDAAEPPSGHWVRLTTALELMASLKILGLGCHSLCDEVLAVIGRKVGLKVLTLRFRRNQHVDISRLQVPDGSFTELLRLVVLGAWPNHLFHLMKLQPLIANIRSVRLEVFEGPSLDRHLDKVFEMLRDGAKRLKDLDACFPLPVEGPYEIQSGQLMLIISEIPLKRIGLRNVCLPKEQPFHDFLEQCNKWQTTIMHFVMPDQPATPHDIELLAKFSRLQLLALNLQVIGAPAVKQAKSKPISGHVLRMESYFLLHHLQPDEVDKLAL
ncbi:hypothetical protein FRC10_009558 [Ceratobasidium sp. 414]|nr:hypothetical protein FRC10_009558 [Ceratobasidium sp. 414]